MSAYKRLLFSLYFFISVIKVSAQHVQKHDEWIDFSKSYLKIEINEDGLYRVLTEDLKKAGYADFKDPAIIYHGKPITFFKSAGFEEGQTGAYIEFFAQKNNGSQDSLVYRPTNALRNPYQSLFSDVSAYFLVSDKTQQKLMQEINTKIDTKTPIYREKLVYAPNKQYSYNNLIGLLPVLQQSFYEAGEGWSGNFVNADTVSSLTFQLPELTNSLGNTINIKYGINGRSRVFHRLAMQINDQQIKDINIDPFGIFVDSYDLNAPDSKALKFTFSSRQKVEFDWYSPTFIEINYDRLFSGKNLNRSFYFSDNFNKTYAYAVEKTSDQVFEISDIHNVKKIKNTGITNSFLSEKTPKLFITNKILKPIKLTSVKFKEYNANTEYLIITSSILSQGASEWANYRSSAEGGKFTTEIAFTDDIYNRFFYGERNPVAIKRAIESILKNQKRKYLYLLGRPVTFPDVLKTANDLVPSFGYPGSDILLSGGLFGEDPDVEGVATGRLNVTKNSEVLQYLQKVKDFEKEGPAEWRKNVIHLSGGENPFEMLLLRNLLSELKPKTNELSIFKSNVIEKVKKSDNPIEEINISNEINQGVGLLTFVGHGSPTIIDLNFGFASDPKRTYANKNKYPLMYFNGCGVGNIFYRYDPLSTNWLLTPDKGSIAIFANSFWSYYNSTKAYLTTLYDALYTDPNTVNLSIGEIHQAMSRKLALNKADPYLLADMHQVVLQGDPALKILPIEKPDFYIKNNYLFLKSITETGKIKDADSVLVGVYAGNLGRYTPEKNISSKLTVKYFDRTDFSKTFPHSPVGFVDTLLFKIPKSKIKNIEFTIDDQNLQDEYNENNNTSKLEFKSESEWTSVETQNTYPEDALPDKTNPIIEVFFNGRRIQNGQAVASTSEIDISLRDERKLEPGKSNLINAFIRSCETCQYLPINNENFKIETVDNYKLVFKYRNQTFNPGQYWLLAQGTDMSGNTTGKPYEINFIVLEGYEKSKFWVTPNPSEGVTTAKITITDKENPSKSYLMVFNSLGKKLMDIPYEAQVGPNEVFLPLKQLYGSGLFIIKNHIEWNQEKIDNAEFKVIVR